MEKTDAELIAEAEGLDAGASPGPWTDYNGSQDSGEGGYIWRKDLDLVTERVLGAEYGYGLEVENGDWQFLLKARTLLPEIARRLKAANERIQELEASEYWAERAKTD